jgi:hypothetical protein
MEKNTSKKLQVVNDRIIMVEVEGPDITGIVSYAVNLAIDNQMDREIDEFFSGIEEMNPEALDWEETYLPCAYEAFGLERPDYWAPEEKAALMFLRTLCIKDWRQWR